MSHRILSRLSSCFLSATTTTSKMMRWLLRHPQLSPWLFAFGPFNVGGADMFRVHFHHFCKGQFEILWLDLLLKLLSLALCIIRLHDTAFLDIAWPHACPSCCPWLSLYLPVWPVKVAIEGISPTASFSRKCSTQNIYYRLNSCHA